MTATVNGFTSAAVSIASAYAPESIKVTDDSGKTIDNITLRVGEEKYLKVRVLPAEASQGFTAVAANPTVASVGAPTPKTIAVTPDSLTPEGRRIRHAVRARRPRRSLAGVHGRYHGQDHRNHQAVTIKDVIKGGQYGRNINHR